METDVVVVGGGAMGSAAAWQLAARGAEVVLIDQFGPGHHFGASHGASRIFRLTYPDPVHIALAERALRLWRVLEAETGEDLLTLTGGIDHGDPASIEPLAAALAAAGTPGEWFAAGEAQERWPGFRFDTRVFHHPTSGRVHADRAVAALQVAAGKSGAVVRHDTKVTGIEVLGDDLVEVRTPEGEIRARRAVVAAGAWTAKLLGGLVKLPKLRVTQEQPSHYAARELDEAGWPSFVHHLAEPYGGVYGLGTPGEGVKVGFHAVGPVVDPDHRDFEARHDLAQALNDYVATWLPGVDPAPVNTISCTYTTTPTSTFVLDRAGPLVVAAGFSGHGFKFVPAIGQVLAGLALDGTRPDPRFSLARHQSAGHQKGDA